MFHLKCKQQPISQLFPLHANVRKKNFMAKSMRLWNAALIRCSFGKRKKNAVLFFTNSDRLTNFMVSVRVQCTVQPNFHRKFPYRFLRYYTFIAIIRYNFCCYYYPTITKNNSLALVVHFANFISVGFCSVNTL